MSLEFWYFKQNLFSDLNVKNSDIYIFHVYWTYIHMQHASMLFHIMFLYLDEFWTKRIFNSKIQVLEIRILVFGNICKTQKWFKKFEICVEIFHTCLYIKENIRNYFCEFLEIL